MYKVVGVLFLVLCIQSCSKDRLLIPVPANEVSINYHRLDLDLANCTSMDAIEELNNRYKITIPEIYAFYVGACLRSGSIDDTLIYSNLLLFTQDEFMQKVHNEIKGEFASTTTFQDEINTAFRYLSYYFENGKLPRDVVFYNSTFTNSVVSSDAEIGVGIERYLGAESEVIKALPEQSFFQYIKNQMEPRFMVRDIMMSWIGANYFSPIDDNSTIAEQLVEWGKMYYITEATIPSEQKSVLLRYTEEEFAWANKNEFAFWRYLVEGEYLFKREQKIALNIFGEAPFTAGLPIDEKASPRLGHFLGWKIVKMYMDSNENTSVQELIELDFKQILKSYKID